MARRRDGEMERRDADLALRLSISPSLRLSVPPSLRSSVSVADFLQYFRSGLDIFLTSVEDLRLNKSEISQASVSSSK
jgi:hypothetical protein